MKILTWNCQGAYRKKSDAIFSIKPDIAVIQECECHGSETSHTFFMYRKKEMPYHIDYCFVPHSWIKRVKEFWIGNYEDWCEISDHCPIYVELNQ